MKFLTIDTTTKATAIALAETQADTTIHVVGEGFLHDYKTHSQRLIPFLDALVAAAGWTLKDLDFIGAVRGPGSFTGIRIGLATAQGLAKVLGCPLCGVLSLDCLSWSAATLSAGILPEAASLGASSRTASSSSRTASSSSRTAEAPLCAVILDARKNEWYAACYQWHSADSRSCRIPPCAVKPIDFLHQLRKEQGGSLYFAGDATLHPPTHELIMEELGSRAVILPPEQALPRGAYAARECGHVWQNGLPAESAPYYIRLSEAETRYVSACQNQ